MPMYNVLEYSRNYKKTTGSLSKYCRDEPSNPLSSISESFPYRSQNLTLNQTQSLSQNLTLNNCNSFTHSNFVLNQDGCLLALLTSPKVGSHFGDSKQVKNLVVILLTLSKSSNLEIIFNDFEQVTKLVLLTLDRFNCFPGSCVSQITASQMTASQMAVSQITAS